MRNLFVLSHRFVGLAIALFLVVSGLTGSVLAFKDEIDAWLNPDFYHSRSEGPLLSPGALVSRVAERDARLQVWFMEYPDDAAQPALLAAVARTDPATGLPYPLRHRVLYLDPVSGEQLGMRHWGECCFEAKNFVPFLLELHYSLKLPGSWGLYMMGGVAILWVIDCFSGLFLTFPRTRPWLAKWWSAWKIRRGQRYRLLFQLHRGGGLWLWLLLLCLAVSSVAMNLPEQVFKPVISIVSPVPLSIYASRGELPPESLGETRLSYDSLYELALREGQRMGLAGKVSELYYSFEYNFYGAAFGNHDAASKEKAWLFFHGSDGSLLGQEIPGRGSIGERLYHLQYPLHSGRIAGLAGRIIIALTGLMVVALSLSGIYISWRKYRARACRAD